MRYEEFERERLDSIYEIIEPYSEMKEDERYFLNGIIRCLKPRKILEVGVANGGGSAIILNAISDIEGAKLYSVDYSKEAYRRPGKLSGFLVEESFPQFLDKWQIFRGGDISRYIDEVGGDIDLLVLDTAHRHPWETLNFLCILPFLKPNSWTVLHDITLYAEPSGRLSSNACRYLYGHVVSDEKITPDPNNNASGFSNIGAFKISENTFRYTDNLFESLLIPWDSPVEKNDISDIKRIIQKYYTSEQYEFFCRAVNFQDYLTEHPASLKNIVRTSLKHYSPKLFNFIQKVKQSVSRRKITKMKH